jgi:hypothetical protein
MESLRPVFRTQKEPQAVFARPLFTTVVKECAVQKTVLANVVGRFAGEELECCFEGLNRSITRGGGGGCRVVLRDTFVVVDTPEIATGTATRSRERIAVAGGNTEFLPGTVCFIGEEKETTMLVLSNMQRRQL